MKMLRVVLLAVLLLVGCDLPGGEEEPPIPPQEPSTTYPAPPTAARPTTYPAPRPTAVRPTTYPAPRPTAARPTAYPAPPAPPSEPTATNTMTRTNTPVNPDTASSPFQPRERVVTLRGSGGSFPAPLYQAWIQDYADIAPGVTITYDMVGSGQGIADFLADQVDFGASDAFISDQDLLAYGREVFHIPTVIGAVSVIYNLPDVEETLRFSGETLTDIFLGNITTWNDPAIAEENPGVALPDVPITVVHRSDSSGTSSIFTTFLSHVSTEWAERVGAGKVVEWPVGIGDEKNHGVAAQVNGMEGAIGYVELTYARANHLPPAAIQNARGAYVVPSLESISEAAAGFLAQMPDDLRINIVNPIEGEHAYPIAAFTWFLVRAEMQDQAKAEALVDFIYWVLTEGSEDARRLDYALLPEPVQKKAIEKLTMITVEGSPVFTQP